MPVDKITLLSLPSGTDGTRETLRIMGDLVRRGKHDPAVFLRSRELVAHLPPKDWIGQVRACYEFVRDSIRYCRDTFGAEGLQTARVTLELGQGDCDDKVIILCALLSALGHPCRMCAVKLDDEAEYSHVFAQTWIGNGWVTLETTEGPLPMGDGGPQFARIKQPMMCYTVR